MMRGQTQEAFFACLRDSLKDRGRPVDLPADVEIARVVTAATDLVTLFMERTRQVGMKPERVADEQAAAAKVAEIIGTAEGSTAILPEDDVPARSQIAESLAAKKIRLLDVNDRDASFDADFGITGVTWAVAETGSLCVESGGAHRRLASLAVPNHIAVVRADQILPDLLDLAAHTPAEIAANQTLISAPSKTADIEMILVEGVHGPKTVYVLVIG